MQIDMVTLVMTILGTACGILLIWLVHGSENEEYDGYIAVLDGDSYFLKSMYGIGYYLIEKAEIDFASMKFRDKEKKIAELKGKKYARFYMVADYAGMITYVVLFATVGFLLGGVTGRFEIAAICIMLGVFLAFYLAYTNNKIVEDRHEKVMQEFPHLLSKMALLINAGMPLREAIESSIRGKKAILSEEFGTVLSEMENGTSDIEAMMGLAERCDVPEVKKLVSMIVQNLQKGSAELGKNLMEMSSEIWKERVSGVKEIGEKASTKLLLPILIIFFGIMLMVIVPFFSSLSF